MSSPSPLYPTTASLFLSLSINFKSFFLSFSLMASNCITKTRSKNRGLKTKLCCGCFKPGTTTTVEDAFEPSTYSTFLSSALSTVADYNHRTTTFWWNNKRKNNDDDCLWHFLKNAFHNTNLLRKIKKRRNRNRFTTSSSDLKYSDKILKERKSNLSSSLDSTILSTSLSTSSLPNRSSLSSSTSLGPPLSSSPSPKGHGNLFGLITTTKKHEEKDKVDGQHSGKQDLEVKLCSIVMVSLVVLILWGKFFAILCTSMWIYLFPCRIQQCKRPVKGYNDEFDSIEYKKRIVMKGLLHRNHNRWNV